MTRASTTQPLDTSEDDLPSNLATVRKAHARVGGLLKNRADEAAVEAARVNLKMVKAQEYLRQLVDSDPPLSDEQRADLAGILLPSCSKDVEA